MELQLNSAIESYSELKDHLYNDGINPDKVTYCTKFNKNAYGIQVLIDGQYSEGLFFSYSPFKQLIRITISCNTY